MADNSASFAKMARLLAILHIITWVLWVLFEIADRCVQYRWGVGTGSGYYGIWIGIWLGITGLLRKRVRGKERATFRNVFAKVFMGFSITSSALGGFIILVYRMEIEAITHKGVSNYQFVLVVIMLNLGIGTLVIGISAAMKVFLLNPCNCCVQTQGEQRRVYYTNLADGYDITQVCGSVPVVIPMQPDGGGAAAQGYHRPMVQVPVSGASGGQQLIVQAASYEGMAMGTQQQQFQPHFVHISPTKAIPSTDSPIQ